MTELVRTDVLGHVQEHEVPFVTFEIDDTCYAVSETHSEAVVVPELETPLDAAEAAEAAGIDVIVIEREEVMNWLADRWNAIGGPRVYAPAFAFFHYGSGVHAFHLEDRVWVEEYPAAD